MTNEDERKAHELARQEREAMRGKARPLPHGWYRLCARCGTYHPFRVDCPQIKRRL